jgi:hypothetical protein
VEVDVENVAFFCNMFETLLLGSMTWGKKVTVVKKLIPLKEIWGFVIILFVITCD